MAIFKNPEDKDYDALVAENRFVSDIQLAVETALDERGLSKSDLARMLNVSPARVTQMLSNNGANLTARSVARIAHVLGVKACVNFVDECLDGWLREQHEEVVPAAQAIDWMKVALEVGDYHVIGNGAPSNDGWKDVTKTPEERSAHAPGRVAA